MNHPAIYIAQVNHYAGRIAQLWNGPVQVVSDTNTAIRTFRPGKDQRGFIFYEQRQAVHDAKQLHFLRSHFPACAIVLLTGPEGLARADRHTYLEAGVSLALRGDTDAAAFEQSIRFLAEHALRHKSVVRTPQRVGAPFRMPLWKRAFDILASGTALILLSPLLLAVAVAIKLDSPGPVLYRSKRVGSNYRVFDFLKFRSMRTDADCRLRELKELNQYASDTDAAATPAKMNLSEGEIAEILKNVEQGMLLTDDFLVTEEDHLSHIQTQKKNTFVKLENDPRVTRLGRFLRKYSIDELPQLFNILRGDMSVVGNRPLPLYEAEHLTSDEYIERFMCPSGLTGLWQVEKRGGKGKLSPEQRKQLDIRYAKTMSPWLDLKILLRTFTAFVQKENV